MKFSKDTSIVEQLNHAHKDNPSKLLGHGFPHKRITEEIVKKIFDEAGYRYVAIHLSGCDFLTICIDLTIYVNTMLSENMRVYVATSKYIHLMHKGGAVVRFGEGEISLDNMANMAALASIMPAKEIVRLVKSHGIDTSQSPTIKELENMISVITKKYEVSRSVAFDRLTLLSQVYFSNPHRNKFYNEGSVL